MPQSIPQSALLDLLRQAKSQEDIDSSTAANFVIAQALNAIDTPCVIFRRTVSLNEGMHSHHICALSTTQDGWDVFNAEGLVGWDEVLQSYMMLYPSSYGSPAVWEGPPHLQSMSSSYDKQKFKPLVERILTLGQKCIINDELDQVLTDPKPQARRAL